MQTAQNRVEVWPSRRSLVLAILAACGIVAFGVWDRGFTGWLVAVLGGALLARLLYQLARHRPRLILSEQGIEWIGGKLEWGDIETMRELYWGSRPARFRILALTTVERRAGTRPNRLLFRADYTINISALQQSADAVLALVEQFSGRAVERVRK